ncbi:MAG: 23S rRNA (uracil(1939)-C(5))-methyltransferase RlmD [Bacteroidales bacterium]|nr:23S rRNA (uracil(1939)-C(5))-methyltransferase RlmD [Bacteroidales bacterium]
MMNCPSSARCGACQFLPLPYAQQLLRKRESVSRAFQAEGLSLPVREVCGMADPRHYRNKVIAAVSMRGTRVVCGLYEEWSHRVVPTPDCLLQDPHLNGVLGSLESLLNRMKIRPFGFGGTLKHVLLRVGVRTGQVMVVLVTSEELMHGRRELLSSLRAAHPEIATVVQNIQPRQTSVVLGPREKVLFGPGYIIDELLGLRYKISARSFYQVNPSQTERLYAQALSLAAFRPDERLLDAYCGIGTIGLSAAASLADRERNPVSGGVRADVLGVEINGDAVRDAVANARANGIRNARFCCADVSGFLRTFEEPVDVLMLDPPRAGCDRDFLRSVLQLGPQRIVYVSCNPATQARDVAYLTHVGHYRLASDAFPFDLFPHTGHVENVLLLRRA